MQSTTGWTIWLTGLPASGKTVVAQKLQDALRTYAVNSIILDSDALRAILTPTPAYDAAERECFYRQVVQLALLLNGQSSNVIIAATGHRRAYRVAARALLAPYAEVWLRCPPEVCRARDPKGLYANAVGKANNRLPGVGVAYEAPEAPDLIIDSDRTCPELAATSILESIPFLRVFATDDSENWRYPW